jgi:Protein of unknown function (DUF2778)
MQGIDATLGDISFGRDQNPGPDLHPIIPAAIALALAGSVAVCAWVLHARNAAAPDFVNAPLARLVPPPKAAPATGAAAKPYGEIVIDPSFLAEMKMAPPAGNLSPLASLDNAPPPSPAPFPLPSLDAFPPEPSAGAPQAETVLPPQKPDTLDIGESAPLPPPRPPEFAMPATPAAPERHLAQPNGASPVVAPADNRNFLQRLFGLGLAPAPASASRPAVASAPVAPSGPAVTSRPASTSGVAVASAAPESRGAGRVLLGAPFGASAPGSGYDRYTAVYDISARTVYLPDGTRLEAHSGLGDRLDNPRYVSERMHGPTPPHVYELALREGSFHGVQALRLNPIGEGDLFGRAGLLAHPFMLGPNGDSNGCVSVKDYEAFLRAYQNGLIKRLVVVANL